MRTAFVICFFLVYITSAAQIELCEGNKGEVVFYENFGEGIGYGSAMSAGTTTFSYTSGFPEEGRYTIYSNTFPGLVNLPDPGDPWLWHLTNSDWSYNLNSQTGKMLLINANEIPGVFYKKKITNLCERTSYEFSLWAAALYNVNSGICSENNGIGTPINLKLEVWDITETQLLKEAETGNINNTSSLIFENYGVLFTTLPGQTEVVVKVINNNQQSGCGNDIAIDEIIVQVCGGASILSSQGYDDNIALFCAEDVPVSLTLNLETFYQGSYFIWQQSTNGSSWVNVGGVTTFNTGGIYSFNANNISSTTYFRVKFASVISNFDSPLTSPDNIRCLWYSNTFMINIFTAGAPSSFSGDPIYCGNSPIPPLAVFPVPGVTVNWYDSPNGGNLLHSNSFNYYPPGPGTYYAEFATSGISCNTERTPFTLTWIPGVELPENPDPIFICGGETVILDAGYENGIYQWEPAWLGNTQTVTVSDPGIYTVTVQNQSNCTDSRTFIIEGYTAPQIVDIFNVGTTVTVIMSNEDTFEYSLDGVFWQTSNIFENVRPGIVTVYVRDVIQCGLDIQEYFLLFPPLFFTPNGDGVNDIFLIEGINRFDLEVMIFDRYGKLLTVLNSNNPYWDGTYRGEDLPSSDYWYSITHNNSVVMKGHFTLKR